MKKFVTLSIFTFLFAFSANVVKAQISADSLEKMNIFQVCKAIGISGVYADRYYEVIVPLCEAGIMLFDAKSNQYADADEVKNNVHSCYWYVGSGPQNEKLARNLLANRELFQNGKLIPGAAKKWKIVD